MRSSRSGRQIAPSACVQVLLKDNGSGLERANIVGITITPLDTDRNLTGGTIIHSLPPPGNLPLSAQVDQLSQLSSN